MGNFVNIGNEFQMKNLSIDVAINFSSKPEELDIGYVTVNNFVIDRENKQDIPFHEIMDLVEPLLAEGKTLFLYDLDYKVVMPIIIAIVMKQKNWPLDLASAYILTKRPDVEMETWIYSQLLSIDVRNMSSKNIKFIK
mmetsp:Transcript_35062/g.39777  ORF Transcript_35062/g.39777 Transcript_35062/m.39777 type:complete len:138 (-) Transcript_35062:384-797(-)